VRSPTPVERIAQLRRLLASEGARDVGVRLRERAAKWLSPPGSRRLPVERSDLRRAAEVAAGGWRLPGPAPWRAGEPLRVAWVCVPPSEGSGGHTTMFRMVSALERAGHRCVVHLQDRHGWALAQHQRTIRRAWPWVQAEIRDLRDGFDDAHAIFATGWMTAYPILASPALGARCYLVQDYEPWFYPAGSESLLAQATYRFPFHAFTAGRWLAQMLREDYGMDADHFDFGLDASNYRLDAASGAPARRAGICYYARPSTPRRAHELALLALELFAEAHPEVEIHLYGGVRARVPFGATQHGVLGPAELGALYNRCVAGLVLSATNISLVPLEMLAAGCTPVVNDAPHIRAVLDNPRVRYAPATPFELAGALSALVEQPPAARQAAAERAAASVVSVSWDEAGQQFERALRAVVAAGQREQVAV
jgi:glycosyltransferase involved in cell wall biosynthesis